MENQKHTSLESTDKHYLKSKEAQKTGELILETEKNCNLHKSVFLKTKFNRISELRKQDECFFDNAISVLLTKIANLSGIKGGIEEINKYDIFEMILMRFAALSLDEIYYAFKLERYGSHEAKTSHFGMFGAEYVSEVLNKYIKWKEKTRVELNLIKNELDYKKQEENLKNLSIEDVLNAQKELDKKNEEAIKIDLDRAIKQYKDAGFVFGSHTHIYEYLEKKGEINRDRGYINRIFERAKLIKIAELKGKNIVVEKKQVEIKKVKEGKCESVKIIAKELCFHDYLKKITEV